MPGYALFNIEVGGLFQNKCKNHKIDLVGKLIRLPLHPLTKWAVKKRRRQEEKTRIGHCKLLLEKVEKN
jgi:hypothetical protein